MSTPAGPAAACGGAGNLNVCPPSRKQDLYRFCWYLPLARLKLRWVAERRSPDLRLHAIRSKMFLFQQQLRQHKTVRLRGGGTNAGVFVCDET